jgi:hypothetical protein
MALAKIWPRKKPVRRKMPEKKKGLPILQIIGAIIVIAIVGGVLVLQSLNDPISKSEMGIPDVGIDVLEAPYSANVGDSITITWRLIGVTVDKSELVYSNNARGGFGSDFDTSTLTVDGSTYEDISEGQPGESEFEGQTFTTTINVEYVPIFMRIHGVSGETNYWLQDELVVLEGEE